MIKLFSWCVTLTLHFLISPNKDPGDCTGSPTQVRIISSSQDQSVKKLTSVCTFNFSLPHSLTNSQLSGTKTGAPFVAHYQSTTKENIMKPKNCFLSFQSLFFFLFLVLHSLAEKVINCKFI